jgi:hypothetical protein
VKFKPVDDSAVSEAPQARPFGSSFPDGRFEARFPVGHALQRLDPSGSPKCKNRSNPGEIAFNDNGVETLLRDEPLGNLRPLATKLRGFVRGFAETHDTYFASPNGVICVVLPPKMADLSSMLKSR